jgi:selenocysteine lyase/cysteine desulfurase
VGIYGLKGSLEVIHEMGIKNVETWVLGLTDYLVEKLEKKGYSVFSSRRDGEKSGIVSFYSKQHNLSRIHSNLTSKDVIVSLRDSRIRVSPHFYNTHEDIDKLLKYLP